MNQGQDNALTKAEEGFFRDLLEKAEDGSTIQLARSLVEAFFQEALREAEVALPVDNGAWRSIGTIALDCVDGASVDLASHADSLRQPTRDGVRKVSEKAVADKNIYLRYANRYIDRLHLERPSALETVQQCLSHNGKNEAF